MLVHLPYFDFGLNVFVDIFHLVELGVIKTQLELTLASMADASFSALCDRMKLHAVCTSINLASIKI